MGLTLALAKGRVEERISLLALAWLGFDVVEHVLTTQCFGDSFGCVFREWVIRIRAGDLEQAIVEHHDPELSERHAGRDQNLVHVVNAETAGLLNPVFDERVAQSVLGFRFGKIRAFDDETVFAHCCLAIDSVGRPRITLPPYPLTAKQKMKSVFVV